MFCCLYIEIVRDCWYTLQVIWSTSFNRSWMRLGVWLMLNSKLQTSPKPCSLQTLIYSCGTILGPVRSFSNITIPLPSDAQFSYWTITLVSWWPRFLMEDCQTNRKLSVSRLGKELLATWQKQARHDKESRHDCTCLYLCLCLFYVIKDALLFVSQLIMSVSIPITWFVYLTLRWFIPEFIRSSSNSVQARWWTFVMRISTPNSSSKWTRTQDSTQKISSVSPSC